MCEGAAAKKYRPHSIRMVLEVGGQTAIARRHKTPAKCTAAEARDYSHACRSCVLLRCSLRIESHSYIVLAIANPPPDDPSRDTVIRRSRAALPRPFNGRERHAQKLREFGWGIKIAVRRHDRPFLKSALGRMASVPGLRAARFYPACCILAPEGRLCQCGYGSMLFSRKTACFCFGENAAPTSHPVLKSALALAAIQAL